MTKGDRFFASPFGKLRARFRMTTLCHSEAGSPAEESTFKSASLFVTRQSVIFVTQGCRRNLSGTCALFFDGEFKNTEHGQQAFIKQLAAV